MWFPILFFSFQSSTLIIAIFPILVQSFVVESRHYAKRFQEASSFVSSLRMVDNCIVVAMTREEGKNGKLSKKLQLDEEIKRLRVETLELPCIAHSDGPDFERLHHCIQDESWDYIAITSPEAASVLTRSLRDSSLAITAKLVAVGKATEEELKKNGLSVAFTPSQAYAKSLVAELPGEPGMKVLYPASCRAPGTLADGLKGRGFEVTRLNTYDTIMSDWTDTQKQAAKQCKIVCFASPSSVKGWLNNSGNNKTALAACIGQTSADACYDLGWDKGDIYYPESPGVDGWVDAVKQAAYRLRALSAV